MINKKNHPARKTTPESLTADSALQKLQEIINSAPNHKLSTIYNSKEVKEQLEKIYGSKCAYCESDWLGSSSPRVDHFRPKRNIKEVDKLTHYGYYWLSLEWTNLILSCESCNTKKWNKFPLKEEAKRIPGVGINPEVSPYDQAGRDFTSSVLEDEGRLLLHPELDNVETHLVFLPNGELEGGSSEMGETSIDVYGLNRGFLILSRKRKVDKYFNKLIDMLNDFEDAGADEYAKLMLNRDLRNYFSDLLEEQDEAVAYSRLGFFMFDNFKEFYVDRLPKELEEHKKIIEDFYKELID